MAAEGAREGTLILEVNMRLIHGVGINDATYPTRKVEKIDGKVVQTWTCPLFSRWKGVVNRTFSQYEHKRYPRYIGTELYEDWKSFMKFRSWLEDHYFDGCQIDKDLLTIGTGIKLYSPDTCLVVDNETNSFILGCCARRGDTPIGVGFHKASGKYRARCGDSYLGLFLDPFEGHVEWQKSKAMKAEILANRQHDQRVVDALIRFRDMVLTDIKHNRETIII